MSRQNMLFGLPLLLVLAATGVPPTPCHAADCNNNGVEDATDIAAATSDDCNVNAVPDGCEGDFDADGLIDGCDDCGVQLTDNNVNDGWDKRQSTTSRGRLLWFNDDDTVFYYDGQQAAPIQAKDVNDPTLDSIASFVFTLGSGAGPDDVIGAWRRGTDFAWVWMNNGQPPRLVQYTSPYQAGDAMNPEGVAIADGCLFMLLQAFDPGTNKLIKHVYKIDPASGDSTLLTGDFLNDTANAGTGAYSTAFVTSGCKAAWAWCSKSTNGACDDDGLQLHYYDGSSVQVLEADAFPTSFAMGRLIYIKPVDGVSQVFLYDTNLDSPSPVQLTDFGPNEKGSLFAKTDGYHVAILRGDANGKNRDIVTLGGFALTDADTRPSDQPNNNVVPIQVDRGQLLWETHRGSFMVYGGRVTETVCSQGWLADGFVGMSRMTDATGDDTEIFRKQLSPPADPSRPAAPWVITAEATANGEVTLAWEPLLGVTSYNVYLAREPGVTKDNFAALTGGRHLSADDSNSLVINDLPGNADWYFVVATVEGDEEGPVSAEATANPCFDDTLDRDADGIADCLDNCPDVANASQADADADGLGDDCDADPVQSVANDCCGGGLPAMMPMMLGAWIVHCRHRTRRRPGASTTPARWVSAFPTRPCPDNCDPLAPCKGEPRNAQPKP